MPTPWTTGRAPEDDLPGPRYALGLGAWGLATAVYLGLVAGLPHDVVAGPGALSPVLFTLPVVAVLLLERRLDRTERRRLVVRVAPGYLAALLAAVALDVLVLDHGTIPAVLVGLLPALPCWLDAWRVARGDSSGRRVVRGRGVR